MQALYNAGIRAYGLAVKLASFKNEKAKLWLTGRKNWRQRLSSAVNAADRPIWIHAASLGEMEAGLPIVEALRKRYPEKFILLSFFSPSGFENFKEKHLANHICYLPLDSPKNASDFISMVNPCLALFIKYEIWVNYFKQLQKAGIPLILAPALFREKQFFFSPIAWKFYQGIFEGINKILVQNKQSLRLLESKGLTNVSVCGDTRFDRVLRLTQEVYEHHQSVRNFLGDKFCLIGGSSWPPEEEILMEALKSRSDFKLILAPHLVDSKNIERVERAFSQFGLSRFSSSQWLAEHRVLLIDNIGQLKLLYRFGHFALVGGAFGPGVHSTIEAVAYKIPVAFGPNHQKFLEPTEMIERGFGFEIKDAQAFIPLLNALVDKPEHYQRLQSKIEDYLRSKGQATDKILTAISEVLQA